MLCKRLMTVPSREAIIRSQTQSALVWELSKRQDWRNKRLNALVAHKSKQEN